jgi:hypothetical protein
VIEIVLAYWNIQNLLDEGKRAYCHLIVTQKKKALEEKPPKALVADGAPGKIRTPDLRIRSPLLYPAELRAHNQIEKLLPDLLLIVHKKMSRMNKILSDS